MQHRRPVTDGRAVRTPRDEVAGAGRSVVVLLDDVVDLDDVVLVQAHSLMTQRDEFLKMWDRPSDVLGRRCDDSGRAVGVAHRLRERIVNNMESTFTPNSTATRRRKITKFALAGVAVLGVGAALTSAAWSDDVFFNGTAKTAAFELQGWDPVNGGYKDADNDTLSITLPGNALTGVGPGISARYAVTVHNGGEIPINLQAPVTTSRLGTLFEGLNPAGVTYSGYSGDGVLTAGEDETVDVIVTGPLSWAGIDYQNTSGSLTIRITGTS